MEQRTSSGSPWAVSRRRRALAALGLITVAVLWLARSPGRPDIQDRPAETEHPPREVAPAADPAEPAISHRSALSPPSDDIWAGASLAGRVVSAAGEPVQDAEVHIATRSEWLHLTREASARPRDPETRTDADGRFVFAGVPTRANATLRVRAPGFAEADSSWYGTIPAAELLDVGDLILDEECVLRGDVRDERGAPIAGALIYDHGNVLPAGPHVTDDAGRFEIRGVEAYRYDLIASARGFAPPLPPYPERELRVGETWEGIRFVLSRGVAVDGRVIDEAGHPVEGAAITLAHGFSALTAGGFIGGGSYAPGHPTDAEGRFSVYAVPGAEGAVSVQAEGYARASKPLPPPVPGESATSAAVGDIVVSRLRRIRFRVVDKNGAVTPARPPWIQLSFTASAAITGDDTGDGLITDHDHDPRPPRPQVRPRFPGAETVTPAGHQEHHAATEESWRERPDGFSILSQYRGTFTVHIPTVSGGFSCGPFTTTDDPDSEGCLIYLPLAATAVGTVVDRAGRGVAARVQLVVVEKTHVLARACTDTTGRFELVGHELTTPLPTRLLIEPLHHVRREVEIAGLRAGETNELPPVVVDDGAEVAIEVVGPDGGPAAGVEVALWSDGVTVGEQDRFEVAETDVDGRALASCLAAGVWRLRVVPADLWGDQRPTAAPGWTQTPEPGDAVVQLVGGARALVHLDARAAGLSQVAGRVAINGVPARGHDVQFNRPYSLAREPPTCRVRADGTYRSPLLYPQEVRVAVLRHGLDEELAADRVTPLPGSTSRLDLDLHPARLSVRVVDDAGALVPSAVDLICHRGTPAWPDYDDEEVEETREFRRSGNLVRGHAAGEDTALSFEDLPPGRWSVVIERLDASIDEEQTVYITLAPGEDRELSVRRAYTGAWRIRLITNGEPQWEDRLRDAEEAGAMIQLRATRQDGLRHLFEMTIDDHGVVDEDEIEPGRWDLQLVLVGNGAPRVLAVTSIEVFSGQTAEAVLPVRE